MIVAATINMPEKNKIKLYLVRVQYCRIYLQFLTSKETCG